MGFQLVEQRLPDRQLVAAASPARPGEQHALAAPELAERHRVAVEVGELERRRRSAGDRGRLGAGTTAATPSSASTAIGRRRAAAHSARSIRPSAPAIVRPSSGTQTSPLHSPSGLSAQPVAGAVVGVDGGGVAGQVMGGPALVEQQHRLA